MKHLIAILAHKNPEHLEILVNECTSRGYDVLIHIDKKSREILLRNTPHIAQYTLSESVDVDRAHHSILEATHLLLEASLDKSFDYFHLISGEDFLVKSANEFEQFFSENNGANFLNHVQLPITAAYDETQDSRLSQYSIFKDKMPTKNYLFPFFKNGIGLVDTYHFRPSSNLAKILKALTPTYRLRQFYLYLFKRQLPDMDFYAGSAWFSITKELATFYSSYRKESPELYEYLRYGLFPDEVYFQTITMQSTFKSNLINSDLRYIDWTKPVNDGPSQIKLELLENIKQSSGFFARKFDLGTDAELKEQLYKTLYDTH